MAASRLFAAASITTTIVMTGGERVAADVAVLAIGYKLGVPFLPQAFRDRLVEPDGQYRLYRLIANPDLPDMGFVGINSSFCTVLCAEMAANWLVRFADGQLAHQPTPAEMHDNIEMMLRFKRVERPAAGVYGGLRVAPYHFKHFDEMLADIGATSAAAIHWWSNLPRRMRMPMQDFLARRRTTR